MKHQKEIVAKIAEILEKFKDESPVSIEAVHETAQNANLQRVTIEIVMTNTSLEAGKIFLINPHVKN